MQCLFSTANRKRIRNTNAYAVCVWPCEMGWERNDENTIEIHIKFISYRQRHYHYLWLSENSVDTLHSSFAFWWISDLNGKTFARQMVQSNRRDRKGLMWPNKTRLNYHWEHWTHTLIIKWKKVCDYFVHTCLSQWCSTHNWMTNNFKKNNSFKLDAIHVWHVTIAFTAWRATVMVNGMRWAGGHSCLLI